jgi:hypothetical protein
MKFDITLINERMGITTAEVPWATDVPAEQVGARAHDLALRMQAEPDTFPGKVLITICEQADILPLPVCEREG